jgi:hypothetical protein
MSALRKFYYNIICCSIDFDTKTLLRRFSAYPDKPYILYNQKSFAVDEQHHKPIYDKILHVESGKKALFTPDVGDPIRPELRNYIY